MKRLGFLGARVLVEEMRGFWRSSSLDEVEEKKGDLQMKRII